MSAKQSEGEPPVSSLAGAKDLARLTKERAGRLRDTPGLIDGSLEEVRGSMEKLLREFDRLSRGRFGAFNKDLDAIAKRAKDLEEAGRLSPRHAKLINVALQHTRRIHFWNARRALAKIDATLEPVRLWRHGIEEYRAFHRTTAARVREGEATLEALRAVPKPPAGPEEVAKTHALMETCNRAVDEAWVAQTHRAVADAIKDLQSHPDMDGLGLLAAQEFAALRGIGDLFESDPAVGETLGTRPLSDLALTSEYSVAKWDRVFPEAAHQRKKLQELFHQLRPIVTGKHGAPFELGADVRTLQRRVAAWRAFPRTGEVHAWTDLAGLLQEGRIPPIQDSARMYERFGDLAKRAWDGSLAKEIEGQETELKAAKKDLAALADPETLAK